MVDATREAARAVARGDSTGRRRSSAGRQVAPPGAALHGGDRDDRVVVTGSGRRSTASAGCSTRCRRSTVTAEAVAAREDPTPVSRGRAAGEARCGHLLAVAMAGVLLCSAPPWPSWARWWSRTGGPRPRADLAALAGAGAAARGEDAVPGRSRAWPPSTARTARRCERRRRRRSRSRCGSPGRTGWVRQADLDAPGPRRARRRERGSDPVVVDLATLVLVDLVELLRQLLELLALAAVLHATSATPNLAMEKPHRIATPAPSPIRKMANALSPVEERRRPSLPKTRDEDRQRTAAGQEETDDEHARETLLALASRASSSAHGARLVEGVVLVAALGRLDARRAALLAGAGGDALAGGGQPLAGGAGSRARRSPAPPGWPS